MFCQLRNIDCNENPHFYSESSQHEDDNYQPQCLDELDSQGEEEGEEETPPAYTRPVRDQFIDPVFRAGLERVILQQHERITGETPWNNNRNIPR